MRRPMRKELDYLASSLNLSQLIVEPTNFQVTNCTPSCIDLAFCDQPNLVMQSGTHPALDTHCKHQIIFCRLNYLIPPAPVFKRKVWHYKDANINGIQSSVQTFPWIHHLQLNPDPKSVSLTERFSTLCLISYQITTNPKEMMRRQNRMYKNFKRHSVNDRLSPHPRISPQSRKLYFTFLMLVHS